VGPPPAFGGRQAHTEAAASPAGCPPPKNYKPKKKLLRLNSQPSMRAPVLAHLSDPLKQSAPEAE